MAAILLAAPFVSMKPLNANSPPVVAAAVIAAHAVAVAAVDTVETVAAHVAAVAVAVTVVIAETVAATVMVAIAAVTVVIAAIATAAIIDLPPPEAQSFHHGSATAGPWFFCPRDSASVLARHQRGLTLRMAKTD